MKGGLLPLVTSSIHYSVRKGVVALKIVKQNFVKLSDQRGACPATLAIYPLMELCFLTFVDLAATFRVLDPQVFVPDMTVLVDLGHTVCYRLVGDHFGLLFLNPANKIWGIYRNHLSFRPIIPLLIHNLSGRKFLPIVGSR